MLHKDCEYDAVQTEEANLHLVHPALECKITHRNVATNETIEEDNVRLLHERQRCNNQSATWVCKGPKYIQTNLRYVSIWCRKINNTFGTAFLLLVSVIYWTQGLKSFSSLAVSYYFTKKNIHVFGTITF